MGLTLHQHGHSHSVSHNNVESQVETSNPQQNINVRAAFIHVLGDFIQSFGVFVAALVIFFKVQCSYNFILVIESSLTKK
jgi:Co/Zn/Cd efflux system component